jgi:hypothetical protein
MILTPTSFIVRLIEEYTLYRLAKREQQRWTYPELHYSNFAGLKK